MSIIILQHGERGGPGRLGTILRDDGYRLDVRRADLPVERGNRGVPTDLDDIHGLVILGGEQNVTDIARHPWMQQEAALIRKAHAAMIPIVGICLGSQLIAYALGGTVGPKESPDSGFRMMDVTIPGQTETLLAGVPWRSPQLFLCGQEVKTLPAGAMVLASTPSTKIAVYKAGLRTYGFLNHFECDRAMIEDFGGLACGIGAASGGSGSIENQLAIDEHYPTYARVSERLCRNITAYLLPESRRLVA
jgi:GMP synthase (glutamine-hydrolysing)